MSISRNTTVNIVGQALPVVVTLVVIPRYLLAIGDDRYGVLSIVWMLLGYFGLFDLGLNRAVAQRVAALRDEPPERRSQVVWTSLLLAGGLSLVGAAAFYAAGRLRLFDRSLGPHSSLLPEFHAALPLMALVLPASLVGGTLSGTLQARERFVSLNLIQTVGTVWSQVAPLAVAQWWSVRLPWLIAAALSAQLITSLWMLMECRRQVPLTPRPVFDRSQVRPLFSFGGWVTVSSIVAPILFGFDRMVIGAISGTAAVAHYVVPFNVVSRPAVVPSALSGALFPRFAAGSRSERLDLLTRSTGALAALFTVITLGLLLLLEPFLRYWLKAKFTPEGVVIGELLAVGFWFNALGYLPNAYLQANARPRISAIFHAAELAPYLALLWFGVRYWGAPGAAAAGGIRLIVDAILHYGATGFAGSGWRELLVPVVLVGAGLAVVLTLGPADPWRWVAGAALLAISAFWGWDRLPDTWRRRAAPLFAWRRQRA